MLVDFKTVEVRTLEGEILPDIHKTVGNLIYRFTKDLGMVAVAEKIYAGETVDLDKTELQEVERLLSNPQSGLFAFVRKALGDYVQTLRKG